MYIEKNTCKGVTALSFRAGSYSIEWRDLDSIQVHAYRWHVMRLYLDPVWVRPRLLPHIQGGKTSHTWHAGIAPHYAFSRPPLLAHIHKIVFLEGITHLWGTQTNLDINANTKCYSCIFRMLPGESCLGQITYLPFHVLYLCVPLMGKFASDSYWLWLIVIHWLLTHTNSDCDHYTSWGSPNLHLTQSQGDDAAFPTLYQPTYWKLLGPCFPLAIKND